jgi:hypothetical protein
MLAVIGSAIAARPSRSDIQYTPATIAKAAPIRLRNTNRIVFS